MFDTFVHGLHLLAAAVWVGGMIFAGFVLAPIARRDLPPQVRYPLFKAVGERFAVLGRAALAVLVVTGGYKLFLIWRSLDFLGSGYRSALWIKLCLVFAMIVLSVLHDFVWGPRLVNLSARPDSLEYRRTLSRLSWGARVNVALAVLIVFLGAILRMNPF